MCAQGQVLHLLGGWSPSKLHNAGQKLADKATAKLLNISIAHSTLLRSINDKADGAPSVVLTHPEKVLGDQAKIILAFWLHLDGMKAKDWDAARAAARAAAGDAAAARAAARRAPWISLDAARDVARAAARDAARWDAAWAAGYACSEIQGARLMRKRGQAFYFLPLFGFADPESIPALPADYGVPV